MLRTRLGKIHDCGAPSLQRGGIVSRTPLSEKRYPAWNRAAGLRDRQSGLPNMFIAQASSSGYETGTSSTFTSASQQVILSPRMHVYNWPACGHYICLPLQASR